MIKNIYLCTSASIKVVNNEFSVDQHYCASSNVLQMVQILGYTDANDKPGSIVYTLMVINICVDI